MSQVSSAARSSTVPLGVVAQASGTSRTLRVGERGPEVVELQQLLSAKGLLSGAADGKFGPGTRSAVVAFQSSAGLKADGVVGPATWAALRGQPVPQQSGTGVVGSVPGYSAAQLGFVRTMVRQARAAGIPAELPVITALVETRLRNLSHGDRDSVGLFQQRAAWGSFAHRTNPEKSTHMFLYGGKAGQRGAVAFKSRFEGQTSADALGRWAQAVQVSAYPDRYRTEVALARRLIAASGA